jgi:CHAT domain-containing protein/Tfp pilus assembly protein PilF
VRLRGERNGAAISFEIPKGPWDAQARPWGEPDRAWTLFEESKASSNAGRGDKAREALEAALADAPDAQTRVAVQEALAESHQYAGDLARAEAGFRSALETGEAAWGECLVVAGTLTRLGNVLRLQHRWDEAKPLQERALAIRERWAPDGLEVTDSLHQLFLGFAEREDLEKLIELSRRAMAIQERWPPDTLAMADTLNDVAHLAMFRGYHYDAVETFQRSVAILERRAPGSIELATVLGRFGVACRLLGDMEAAVDAQRRALAIRERLAPESLGTAFVFYNLGMLARMRGDLDEAMTLTRRGMDIAARAVPEGSAVAVGLLSLGAMALLRGDLDGAWSLQSHALAIAERLGLGSRTADALGNLGMVAEARGDLEAALDFHLRAEAIQERLSPGTIEEAQTLYQLGRLHRRLGGAGQMDEAARFLGRAVDALESQAGRLVSQDFQAAFRASHEEIYHDAVEVELERGHPAEAFQLVERSRARSFLALLAQRDLSLSGGPPPAKPLDLDAARKVLDPGTLALSYSVGKERTALFAVTREGGLRVETLPLGEEPLRRDVERFLERVRQPAPLSAADAGLARSLYRALIGPVADLVERSERVLILPDGPLHRLPFDALIHDAGGRDEYLVEWKPLHTALSLTVYGTLRSGSAAPRSASSRLVAFGDPRYPKSRAPRGSTWTPLPNTRREVERIAGIYPGASLYVGEEATEERARSVGRDVRIVHFATHGYLNDRSPLDSALVLSIPEEPPAGRSARENGLLQVWEIFESVRLDADLVVLSACESALGREMSGEGMIGLTRAFQYAGARSVVASLWSVADQATAELMTRFHRRYAAGLPKDEALRAAQIELIRGPIQITTSKDRTMTMDASAPFFWAAFELFGDRR